MPEATARGARPNAAIRDRYRESLEALLEKMYNSVEYWLKARYRAREEEIVATDVAQDASPTRDLERELQELFAQWTRNFTAFAQHRARWFADRVTVNTTNQLRGALKDAGLTVRFRNTRRVNTIYRAIIAENVNLIQSIPQQFLGSIYSVVMQSVQNGRDMGFIAREIENTYGVSKRRAITIARDQTNKATEAVSFARCTDIGITHGFWMHRSGGKAPRTTHSGVMNGQRFKLSEGLYDPDPRVQRKVKPAELVNCHCTFRLDLSTITGNGMAMDSKRRGMILVQFPSATVAYAKAAS